ncbi:hypothetical protein SCHPADRAFT_946209 [Schizopora paradoxa]|uniref:Uncharacterized protein n=1 Tax=Schizopora paradoxa TaxID=27342 RepID=A0A0H2R9U3_9AGAM|nr:hypothetical protein SCHPADRAFT_946209 [Schizopora paradoxa]
MNEALADWDEFFATLPLLRGTDFDWMSYKPQEPAKYWNYVRKAGKDAFAMIVLVYYLVSNSADGSNEFEEKLEVIEFAIEHTRGMYERCNPPRLSAEAPGVLRHAQVERTTHTVDKQGGDGVRQANAKRGSVDKPITRSDTKQPIVDLGTGRESSGRGSRNTASELNERHSIGEKRKAEVLDDGLAAEPTRSRLRNANVGKEESRENASETEDDDRVEDEGMKQTAEEDNPKESKETKFDSELEYLQEYWANEHNPAEFSTMKDFNTFHDLAIGTSKSKRLRTSGRPSSVGEWIKDNRPLDFIPEISTQEEFDDFVQSFHLWIFNNIPPSCRPADRFEDDAEASVTWPIVRSIMEDDEDSIVWTKLAAVEGNGFFIWLMVLHWWKSLDKDGKFGSKREYEATLRDIRWLLKELIERIRALPKSPKGARGGSTGKKPETPTKPRSSKGQKVARTPRTPASPAKKL